MRNLRTVAYRETVLPPTLPLTATGWDTCRDTQICAFGPTPTQPVIELKRRTIKDDQTVFEDITSWDAPCPLPDLECDDVLLLQYFSDTATHCLVLAGGDVVLVREDPTSDQERIEIVGSVDAGICAAAWAPDEELLAIVTRADTLVLMSRIFEPLNEATLTPDDLKFSKHVSAGWGSKETQFQGKRAKAVRDPTVPEMVEEGKASPHDRGQVTISWRGDGQYVAVNSVVPDHRRVIRVFSREAVLDSASEPVDGLEAAVSWRPSGNLIAGVKRSNDKLEVVFFERNGLRHGQFDLRVSQADMDDWASTISLGWNTDSTVLAVSFRDRIQLWTTGNYHFYLKQEIYLGSTCATHKQKWHPEASLRLSTSTSRYLIDLCLLWTTSRGTCIAPFDFGIVAVIDGKTLKLTPFKQAGVPPPMAFCEVGFDYNITDVSISYNSQTIVVLTTHTVELCDWPMRDSSSLGKNAEARLGVHIRTRSVPLPISGSHTRPIYWTQIAHIPGESFILAPPQAGDPAQCRSLPETADGRMSHVLISPTTENLYTNSSHDALFYDDRSRSRLIPFGVEGGASGINLSGGPSTTVVFNAESALFAQANGHSGTDYAASLSPTGILLVDDQVIARNCTSFVLTDAHLLFTTAQHLLKFVHLTAPANMHVPGDTPEVDERCRSIEKGARIVTVIPSNYAVVLQMPRGNLETIYPRLLVLSGVRRHLDELNYYAAFLACQTHQVDMNILCDYNGEKFLANVPKFIEQVRKPSRVDEFLSKLKDEDVTQTLYRDSLKADAHGIQPGNARPSGKVNKIADAFLSCLATLPPAYLKTTITAHVSKRPSDLESALTMVSSLRDESQEEAESAISHLCFLSDANRLFDAALALYDTNVALLVAQNSQRDPREYMPFLQNLHSLPELRKRYSIDHHLKKHARALASLHALGEHDEVQAYTVKHMLYSNALDLYVNDKSHTQSITRLYATYLASSSQHTSAATLYESLQDYSSAYPLYALAHRWRESLSCATMVPVTASQLQSLATNLATNLADEHRDYRSAATIYLDYLSAPSVAAALLCRGSYFAEASRILSLHSLTSSIPTILDSALSSKVGEILELVADCKTQLSHQVPRILELRSIRATDPLAFYGGDPSVSTGMDGAGADIPDNVSLAATDTSTLGGQSLFTRAGGTQFGGTVASNASRKTSKTKRREERKRARGKKGSVYEEEYLVASVGRLVGRVNGVHEEVGRLLEGLVRRGMRERAVMVEEAVRGVVDACIKARVDIWDEVKSGDLQEGEITGGQNDGVRPSGADGVLWDAQHDVGRVRVPEVNKWQGNEIVR